MGQASSFRGRGGGLFGGLFCAFGCLIDEGLSVGRIPSPQVRLLPVVTMAADDAMSFRGDTLVDNLETVRLRPGVKIGRSEHPFAERPRHQSSLFAHRLQKMPHRDIGFCRSCVMHTVCPDGFRRNCTLVRVAVMPRTRGRP